MQQDVFDQPVALLSQNALEDWNAMALAFLAHGASTPDHLGRLIGASPECAIAHATKGMFLVLLGRSELMDPAREAYISASALIRDTGQADARTLAYTEALGHCLDGQWTRAVATLEQWLLTAPGDALAMKLDHAIRFVLGDGPGMLRALDRVMPAYGVDHAAHGYYLGCRAFALEEAGEYERAKIAGKTALDVNGDDAWGLHAVAHVHDMTGRAAHGVEWLAGREDAWAHCNNFRYHVWWHKALMLLDLGRVAEVIELYDTQIRADRTDDYRDIANAASLLMRLELDGVPIGNRWAELADLSQDRTQDGCLVFADLHYLLSLIGGGRDTATRMLMRRMRADARDASDPLKMRMAAPGLSAAAGLEAFGAGKYGTAFRNMAAARDTMQLAGGSHAQRDVFERLTIDSGIRAGYLDATEAILDQRTARRAGRDDGYARARRELIRIGRGDMERDRLVAGE